MKEILKNAKKIRNILLYFIDTELKKNSKKNNNILIDSKTSTELSKKYQQFSDYRMEIIETYNGSQMNEVNYNNYFYVAVSYTQCNNNYHVSYENKNFEKVTSNDIVGKYVKEKNIKRISKYENEKNSFNDLSKDNKKRIIGDKKFSNKRKALYSSIEIPQKALITIDENNSEGLNNKKIINKFGNFNKVINNETICANKKRKLKVNYYENKLKKYCSNLIILKKKKISKKTLEPKSPPVKFKQKDIKKHLTLTKEKLEQTIETPNVKKSKDSKEKTDSKQLICKSIYKKQNQKPKEKLWKIPEKKSTHKRARAQSIKDTNLLLNVVKDLHKRNASPKKIQKQLTTQQNDSKNKEIISQKMARKERDKNLEEVNEVKKMISGNIRSKRKMFAAEKATIKWSNKAFQMANKFNFSEQSRNVRRPLYKRANTLNKVHNVFHFKGNELKFKENN